MSERGDGQSTFWNTPRQRLTGNYACRLELCFANNHVALAVADKVGLQLPFKVAVDATALIVAARFKSSRSQPVALGVY